MTTPIFEYKFLILNCFTKIIIFPNISFQFFLYISILYSHKKCMPSKTFFDDICPLFTSNFMSYLMKTSENLSTYYSPFTSILSFYANKKAFFHKLSLFFSPSRRERHTPVVPSNSPHTSYGFIFSILLSSSIFLNPYI